jgi:hypothetical protein
LDVLDFPSLVWYQPDYSVYTVRQASWRSWRIGQRAPVVVTFLVYDHTLQADALGLIAAKVRSALTIEGELPEDGLAALEGDSQDVFLALARRLTEPSNGQDQSLEELFAGVRQVEVEADDYLVDAGRVDETTSDSATDRVSLILQQGDVTSTCQSLFAWQLDGLAESAPTSAHAPATNIVTLDELAGLLQRRRTRRKGVPNNQLPLFSR